jgi:hypothetical protein
LVFQHSASVYSHAEEKGTRMVAREQR